MVLAQRRPHLFLLPLHPGAGSVHIHARSPCLPFCMDADASESVCMFYSESAALQTHQLLCVCGPSCYGTFPRTRGPSSDVVWWTPLRQPTICHLLTNSFLLQNNAQRLGVSQSTHSLTTPVVSVATPSLLSQGLPFSSMPTAYNTGERS